MFESVLKRIREKIRNRQYVMTQHATIEMNDDDLSIYDVEHGILNGRILERQKDEITGDGNIASKEKHLEAIGLKLS